MWAILGNIELSVAKGTIKLSTKYSELLGN